MKLFVVAIFGFLVASAAADNFIDWSTVVPVAELPGFWDGREFKPTFYPEDVTRTSRIVGGTVVTPHTHPYQAGLLITFIAGTGLCGGSLLSNRAILTAAQCLAGSTSTQAILGAHQITTTEPSQLRIIIPTGGYRLHPQYNPSNFNNDIAILITSAAVTINQFIQPIALAASTVGSLSGEVGTVSGWGRISDDSMATSAHLRSVQNTIITNVICAQTHPTRVNSAIVCMSTSAGRGICGGDAGSPLTIPWGGGRLQIGVASFNAPTGCQVNLPAGFARISSFREWIDTNSQP